MGMRNPSDSAHLRAPAGRGRRAHRRSADGGQMIVLVALMAVLIFAASAIAVDLSVSTFNQRTLQNVTDSAVLAGAEDLVGTVTTAEQTSAINDALKAIQTNEGFPSTWAGTSTASACGSGLCETVTYGGYTVKVSTPPQSPRAGTNGGLNDVEADITYTSRNNFAGIIGHPMSNVMAHSVAYHWGPPGPYEYAFFAKEWLGSGNQVEQISGDTYVGNGYFPQSSGKAALCVYNVSQSVDSDGVNDTDSSTDGTSSPDGDNDEQGRIVYGVTDPSSQRDGGGHGPASFNYGVTPSSDPCQGSGNQQLTAQAAISSSSPTNCPTGTQVRNDPSWGYFCYEAPPSPPNIVAPCSKPGDGCTASPLCSVNGSVTVSKTTPPGVYDVAAGCTVTLDLSSGDVQCVSLILQAGANVQTVDGVDNPPAPNPSGTGGNGYMTAYGYDATDSVANQDIQGIGGAVPASSCPGSGINDTKSAIWSAPTTTSPPPVAITNKSTGRSGGTSHVTLFVGALFLPGQQISYGTNQAIEDAGQVYVDQWNVQSGNHPNPTVAYDPQGVPYVAEILRLVE